MTMIRGIDVSKWQGEIDFAKVKASGIAFVIIRAGYGKLASQKDPCFEKNYAKAKAAGLGVGAYWYSYASSVSEACREAEACLEVIKGKRFEYPVYFDLEEKKQFDKGKNFCSEIVKAFCNALENAGYFAGLYISRSLLQTHITEEVAKRYTLWIAEYGGKCRYGGDYAMWQYSSKGRIDGISGDVDLDYCYRNFPSVIKNGGFNGFGKKKK
ncbi:MAG: glycoside hydrolase family 25 protein [Muribaculaceae bacterium]|nr:glycoside hydrolase family 25 protein [Muribaculaceae bacterium]